MKSQPNRNYVSNDVVQTPPSLCKLIVEHFKPTGNVIESCSGEGNFVEALMNYNWCFPVDLPIKSFTEFEISKGTNFLTHFPEKKYDWLISNFPWSEIRAFLFHSMKLSNNIVTLLSINHIWTTARMRDIKENNYGIKEIMLLDWPKEWTKSGFQLGAVHLKKNYKGKCKISDFRNIA